MQDSRSRVFVIAAAVACWSVATTGVLAAERGAPPTNTAEMTAEWTRLQSEIAKMEEELETLAGRERGILGQLEKLDAELRLREAEVREASLRVEEVTRAIERQDTTIEGLDRAQAVRRDYLALRLREIYKGGSKQLIQRVFGGTAEETDRAGVSYASLLSERDARILDAFHRDEERSTLERGELEARRNELGVTRSDLAGRRDSVTATRRRRATMLREIQDDAGRRRQALEETRQAADELGRLADSLGADGDRPALDIRQFKRLLDWPAAGRLRTAFGAVVHPEFKTEVPHPGWDLTAPFAADFSAVFEGDVVFADWMRGYGLTAIVDHGNRVMTIYAHASMLLVQTGERVARGQTLGKVGETGSLHGPFLYFELRVDGKPVDPADWLRQRPG